MDFVVARSRRVSKKGMAKEIIMNASLNLSISSKNELRVKMCIICKCPRRPRRYKINTFHFKIRHTWSQCRAIKVNVFIFVMLLEWICWTSLQSVLSVDVAVRGECPFRYDWPCCKNPQQNVAHRCLSATLLDRKLHPTQHSCTTMQLVAADKQKQLYG